LYRVELHWRLSLPRLLVVLIVLTVAALNLSPAQAQTKAVEGDPPIIALINVSAPDDAGIVTLSGAAGAVYPNAHMSVRNLYTEQVIYTRSGSARPKKPSPHRSATCRDRCPVAPAPSSMAHFLAPCRKPRR
jgi:hypothetical protein